MITDDRRVKIVTRAGCGRACRAWASRLAGVGAGLLVVAGVLSAVSIDNAVPHPADDQPVPEPECLTCCPVGAPPLEPSSQARTG